MPVFKKTGLLVRLWGAFNGALFIIAAVVMYFMSAGFDRAELVPLYGFLALFGFLGIALLWRASVGYKNTDNTHAHGHHRLRRQLNDPEPPFKWHDQKQLDK